jgi:hypothetical protein
MQSYFVSQSILVRTTVLLDCGCNLSLPIVDGLIRHSLGIREATQFHFFAAVTPGTETVLSSFYAAAAELCSIHSNLTGVNLENLVAIVWRL